MCDTGWLVCQRARFITLYVSPQLSVLRNADGCSSFLIRQDKLWSGLRAAADALHAALLAAWHLQRVAAKKRDPLTHVCFLDVLTAPGAASSNGKGAGSGAGGTMALPPAERAWSDALRAISDVCGALCRPGRGGSVREALVSGYPRFAAILEGAFERLQQDTGVKGALLPEHNWTHGKAESPIWVWGWELESPCLSLANLHAAFTRMYVTMYTQNVRDRAHVTWCRRRDIGGGGARAARRAD